MIDKHRIKSGEYRFVPNLQGVLRVLEGVDDDDLHLGAKQKI